MRPFQINDDTSNSATSDIRYFCKDEWSDVWIVTNLNLYKYNYQIHKAILWSHLLAKEDMRPQMKIIYDNTKKGLWIIGGRDIILADIKGKKITTPFSNHAPSKPTIQRSIAYEYPVDLFIDSKQNLWFSVWEGLIYKYNTLSFQKEMYAVPAGDVESKTLNRPVAYCFEEDGEGKIWIGCYGQGFFYYDEKKDSIQAVSVNNKIPYSFHYEQDIYDLCRDNEGNILACTDKGISILTHSFRQFNTLDENNLLNPFPKASVTSIFETSSGDILAGTWGKGWLMYDKSFRLKMQFYDSNPPTYWRDFRKNMVWSFAEDLSGKIWIGYQYGLIGIFDTSTRHIQFVDPPEFERKTIRAMGCDAKGNIWFGLHSGFLGKWDPAKHKFFMYKNSLQLSKEYAAPISNILINAKEEIWIATDQNGFYRFEPVQEKIVEKYTIRKSDSTLDFVNSLTQINDSIISVHTASKGVLLFNQIQKTFTSITMQDGLPVNHIYGLAEDRQKNLWIATTNGLLRLNSKNHKLVFFDEEDGLLAKKFIYNIVSLRDGRMAIPTSTGIVYFSPDNIGTLSAPPDIKITNLKVFDKSLLIDSILSGHKTIELNHTQNFITIGYASLSFSGRNTTQYFYKLEGVNKDWVAAGAQRFASYTNLSPGHYTFKVKCDNRDGIPSKKITQLNIYIRSPWWFTWWAYCLYALLGGRGSVCTVPESY
jgi:ligand-binding sensor domain-containing protein